MKPQRISYLARYAFKVFFVDAQNGIQSADIGIGPLAPQFDRIRKHWTDEDYARQREPIAALYIAPDLGLPVAGIVKQDQPFILGHFEDQLSRLPISYLAYDGTPTADA